MLIHRFMPPDRVPVDSIHIFSRDTPVNRRPFGVCCIALVSVASCNRTGDSAADDRRFDSLVARRDTMLGRLQPPNDSLALLLEGAKVAALRSLPSPVRSDSELRERPPQPLAAAPATQSAVTGGAPASPKPNVRASSNAMTERAIARGDSIARADANRALGRSGAASAADSMIGTIEIQGVAPRARAVLKTPSRSIVSLSGIATEGLTELGGAGIVARGLKVSPLDLVVKNFLVRTMKGQPAFDGHLLENKGTWSLALTDGSGMKRLTDVPGVLQGAVGARIWITVAPGTSTPSTYGIITRR
jgi:hypothetical protein